MSAVPAGYKQTEVGVIPEDWVTTSIATVCTLINGRGFKPFEWKKAGLPIIRIQNLNGSDEFNYYQGNYDRKLEVDPGQLLFAWSGSRGTSFGPHVWSGTRGLLNYHTWKVQIHESVIDPDFFFHALRKLTEFIEDRAHGAAALVHTQKWEMEGFQFPLPATIAEQRAIAAALSDVDALLAKLDQFIAKKRDLKQAAMQQLLTGQTRLPGFSEEWEVKRLGDVSPLQRGFDLLTTRLRQGCYPVVYSNGVLNYHHEFMVKGPGVVTGRSGTIGNVHFVEENYWPHNTSLWVTNFKGNDPKFIFYLLGNLRLEQFSTGSGVPTLNRNDVHAHKVRIPPTSKEQTAIATVLSDMDAELAALEARRDKTRALKQGMMQELLTGRIRLVEPEKADA